MGRYRGDALVLSNPAIVELAEGSQPAQARALPAIQARRRGRRTGCGALYVRSTYKTPDLPGSQVIWSYGSLGLTADLDTAQFHRIAKNKIKMM